MKLKLSHLRKLIREAIEETGYNKTMETRTVRDPQNYHCVTNWGFTHVPWPEFVKRFPRLAREYAEVCDETSEGKSVEDILSAPALWDDEVFIDTYGDELILGNITGPGGSLWLRYTEEDGWHEVLLLDNGEIDWKAMESFS